MIERMTARREGTAALRKAEEIFGEKLQDKSDALWTGAERRHVFAVSGMKKYLPLAAFFRKEIKDTEQDTLVVLSEEGIRAYTGEGEMPLEEETKQRLKDVCALVAAAPGKLNREGDLLLDLKAPAVGTHYPVNLLLGDREGYADPLQSTPKSVLDSLGRGSFRAAREKQVLASRYVLSPEENGEPYNRQFYLTENGRQIYYSADPKKMKKAVCLQKVNHTEILSETEDLRVIRRIFLLPQKEGFPSAVEVQQILLQDLSGKEREIRLVATGMFGISDPGTIASDIVYANVVTESELCSEEGRPFALSVHHQPKACQCEKRFVILENAGEGMDEFSADIASFLGKGTIEGPEGLFALDNKLTRRGAAFFALGRTVSVPANGQSEVVTCTGMSEGEGDISLQFERELETLWEEMKKPSFAEDMLEEVKERVRKHNAFLQVTSKDPQLNAYASHVLPFQVLYQTYVSRSFAWTQKSYRETGFREIQDLYASIPYLHAQGKDELIKELLSSWIGNVFTMGYAYHNFTVRGKEPGMCSDDALWLSQAVRRYVDLSGDTAFLQQGFPKADGGERRLLDTLRAIVQYSSEISVGKHGLPLLDKADWNDCLRLDPEVLNGPQKEEAYLQQLEEKGQSYGTAWENALSESVMNACLLVIAAEDLSYFASLLGEGETAGYAAAQAARMRGNIRTYAWKEDYYARCLINDGREFSYLGAAGDGLSADPELDGCFYLNSYSWPILSDTASEEEIGKMLKRVEETLKTDAGLKLCTAVDYEKLGVETGSSYYFPGDRENGGVFKHAAMMAVVASLKAARKVQDPELAERLRSLAFFMINKTLPYKTLEDPFVLKGNPRFCTQYNNSETGENIGPILSGTASWLTLALYEICGFRTEGRMIAFDPIIEKDSFAYTLQLPQCSLQVSIEALNDHKRNEHSILKLDGTETGFCLDLPQDGQTHTIEITL